MKRIALLAMAVLVTVTAAVAQPKALKAKQQPQEQPTFITKKGVALNIKESKKLSGRQLSLIKANASKELKARQNRNAKTALKRAARSANESIIIDQPLGTYHSMVYTTDYYGYSLFGLYNGTYTTAFSEVVEGNDGNIYIHNMLTEFPGDSGYWVKAEPVNAAVGTYVIHEQPIYYDESYDEYYYIGKMTLKTASSTFVKATNTDINLTWKNNTLTVTNAKSGALSWNVIGAFSADGSWTGCCNWNASMVEQTDKAVTPPSGTQTIDMVISYDQANPIYNEDYTEIIDYDEPSKISYKGQMAIAGNDMYLQYYSNASGWIKGSIDGGKVTFPTGQYLGGDLESSQHAYFIAIGENGEKVDHVTFDYDPQTITLSNSKDTLYANGGKEELYYMVQLPNPTITKLNDIAATPQAPDMMNMSLTNYNRNYGYGHVDFSASYYDAEGNYLDPDKLYYKVYFAEAPEIGEEPTVYKAFTFNKEDYSTLSASTDEIPYTLSSGEFWCNDENHEFIVYKNIAKIMGIQLIYKGGGESNASEITWIYDNNGYEGQALIPEVENPTVYSLLNNGEIALNLGDAYYGFSSGQMSTENYNVAMRIEDDAFKPLMKDMNIEGVSVPFLGIEGISNLKVWLSTKLDLDADGVFTPDICSKDVTLTDNGYTTVRFDKPYTIPAPTFIPADPQDEDSYDDYKAASFFVGYSFTYDPSKENATDPVVLTNTTVNGGLIIYSDGIYSQGWAHLGGNDEGNLALELILSGANANAAVVSEVAETYTVAGEKGKVNVKVKNYGSNGVKKVAVKSTVLGESLAEGGISSTEEIDCVIAPVFGGYTTVQTLAPAVDATDDCAVYASAENVNGSENAITAEYAASNNYFVVGFMPKKRTLMEEYTGTWCGYCPRGYVGLKKMNELYPEDFVALSYHNDDPMEVMSSYEFPSYVSGFPAAYLDRNKNVDAYLGFGESGFGLDKAWLLCNESFGAADIDVEAIWNNDFTEINVTSKVKFARNENGYDYMIGYALVADGLTGTGSDWAQSNYYNEEIPYYVDAADMTEFYGKGSSVKGLVFDDVIVKLANGIEGSVPQTVEAGKDYSHQYKFTAADVVNTYGVSLIQDKSKMRVVAFLMDSWGNIFNANKCKVGNTTAIHDLNGDSDQVLKTTYYDLSGRKVLVPTNGIYLKTVKLKNGEQQTTKVTLK